MLNITLCKNENCPLKENCTRYITPPNIYYQSFTIFDFKIDKDNKASCDHYYPYEPPIIFYV